MADSWRKRLARLLPKKARSGSSGGPRVYVRPWLLGIWLAFWLAAFLSPHFAETGRLYREGEYADKTIKATRDISWVDAATTETKRDEAEAAVPPVYDYDEGVATDAAAKIAGAFEAMREFYTRYRQVITPAIEPGSGEAPTPQITWLPIPPDVEKERIQKFAETLGVDPDLPGLKKLARRRFDPEIGERVKGYVASILDRLVVADRDLFLNSLPADQDKSFVVRNIQTQRERTISDVTAVSALADVREQLAERIDTELAGKDASLRPAVTALVTAQLKPNLFFNGNETSARRKLARSMVAPVTRTIEKGQLIIGDGRKVTADVEQILQKMYSEQLSRRPLVDFVGLSLLSFILLASLFQFAKANIRKFKPDNKDVLFLFVMTGMTVTLTWVANAVAGAVVGRFDSIPLTALQYGIPVASAAMLVRFILYSEAALPFAAMIAFLVGALFDNSLPMAFYTLTGGVLGAHWLAHASRRQELMVAGLKVGVVNIALVTALELVYPGPGPFNPSGFVMTLAAAFAGGVLSGLVLLALAPLVETVFSYTTDVKLLELANMNHPLLKDMVIKAPGTYNHSILVATLAENAAEAVHANPLLAKVGGLYQDVGKVNKPHYFIENQRAGVNPHDRLYPRMSALILLSHVKEGTELARKYRLGEKVTDIIRQHHGTGIIKYFYKRAQEMCDPKLETCSEDDFRYPGPKPQTREAGIVMLADIVEATSRTLKDPTPARIKSLVEGIIDDVFREGQLDDCELTLRDLDDIAGAFIKVLTGIFHSRIEYPDQQNGSDKNSEKKKSDTGSVQQSPKDSEDSGGAREKAGDAGASVTKLR